MSNVVDDNSMYIVRGVVMSTLRMRRCESEREIARATDTRVIRVMRDALVGEY